MHRGTPSLRHKALKPVAPPLLRNREGEGHRPLRASKEKFFEAFLCPNGNGKMSGGNLLLLPCGHTWGVSLRLGIACVLSYGDVEMQN